jgi:Zn-dependent protease with chaperone function
MQWRLLLYATPAIVGVVLMFFMVKPILARPAARRDPLPIDADAEPVLFGFIDEICRQVRAPRPRRVEIDCAVNASAGFMGGRLNAFRRDLVLTIGLPLVAGLSIRQLGGVLAHEFGHFAQGGGMRLTALVRAVNAWFARVVYERDEWDVKLERWSREADYRLAFVLVLARGAVWVSRRVLTGLMLAGHAISCFMMRQMEYDADSYEIKIAGSDAFVRTMTRLRELNLAAHFAYSDVRDGLGSGTLPADLPAFMVERGRHLPADILAHAHSGHDGKTGVFDTHPSDGDRIRAAEAAGASGVLVGADAGAVLLFRNFDALSAAATRHHFEHDLGLSVGALALVDTSAALRESRRRADNLSAVQRFLGERFSVNRPLHLAVPEIEPLTSGEVRAQLAAAREAMVAAESQVTPQYAEFDALETKRQMAFAAQELLCAGFASLNAADFQLEAGTAAAAVSADERALQEQRTLAPALESFEAAAARRLVCAVILSRRVAADGHLPDDDTGPMVTALNALADVMTDVRELHRLDLAGILIAQNAPSSPQPQQTAAQIDHVWRRIEAQQEKVRSGLMNVACPSGFAASPMTLADRCGFPPDGPPASASDVIDRVFRLYLELLGTLTARALQVEQSLTAEE